MLKVLQALRLVLALSWTSVLADGSAQSFWPDTFLSRIEALAVLQTLNVELLTHDSATLTLEHWCREHRLASPARITAVRSADVDKPPTAEQRRELAVAPTEPVRYRRVTLSCGAVALSEADNWYVPGRLTAEMNTRLETTQEPFGKVVQALDFRRRTLSADLLWRPLAEGWDSTAVRVKDAPAPLIVPPRVLEHRALLTLPDGTPFSEVVETYLDNVMAFPAPGGR